MDEMKKPEILSPAGDPERLAAALLFGADAVYAAGKRFGMRSAPANFDEQQLQEASRLCRAQGKKLYITCNILPRNDEIDELPAYLEQLDMVADALIVADLGVMRLAQKYAPHCDLHVSTQLGVVNYETARMLWDMGASRVVLARELFLDEIAQIRAKTPPELELEAFVHGAMCMSYSGRCLLSSYLTGRDGNHGDCAQPCRWKYELIEPTRPDRPMTVQEDGQGTYLFNANDLCMIEHIPALCRAGISSFKLEGRAKAAYYVAGVTNAYRQAVDSYFASGCDPAWTLPAWLAREPYTVSHRPYGTGFYFGDPSQNTVTGGYIREYQAAAVVTGYEDGYLIVSQRNRFCEGDELETLIPGEQPLTLHAIGLQDEDGEPITATPHPTMTVRIPFERPLPLGSYLRRRV
ncbi:MAG: U32 family peptidase [Clostridia bacterium]|nr:U32 family peptidase [Clostridia bacterium]